MDDDVAHDLLTFLIEEWYIGCDTAIRGSVGPIAASTSFEVNIKANNYQRLIAVCSCGRVDFSLGSLMVS